MAQRDDFVSCRAKLTPQTGKREEELAKHQNVLPSPTPAEPPGAQRGREDREKERESI